MHKDRNYTLAAILIWTMIVYAAFHMASAFGQAGLQGPFVPIENSGGAVVHLDGTVTVPFLWHSTDVNGNDVYTEQPVTMTPAEIAQDMRDQAGNPTNPAHCGALEGLGYTCDPGPPPDVTTTPAGNDPYYESHQGDCYGNPDENLAECWARFQAEMDTYPNRVAVGMQCDSNPSRVQMLQSTCIYGNCNNLTAPGVWGWWTRPNSGWTQCNDSPGTPIPEPNPPTGDPATDENLNSLATNPTTINNFINNRNYYTNNSSTIDNSRTYFSSTSTTITNNYSTATGTTAGSTSMPDGFSSDPGGLGLGDPGTNAPAGGAGDGGSGTGTGEGTGDVNCDRYPNSLGCQDPESDDLGVLGGIIDGLGIDPIATTDIGDDFTPTALPGQGAGSCPDDVAVNFQGAPINIEYDQLCSVATTMNPIVLAVASLLGLYILVGYKSAGV